MLQDFHSLKKQKCETSLRETVGFNFFLRTLHKNEEISTTKQYVKR